MMPNDEFSTSAPDATQTSEEALRQERDELQDRLLRTAAEFDNYRKRTERERREQAELAAADLIRDLLPIIDDMERALAAPLDPGASPQVASYREGIELIRRQFLEVLRRHGVEPLDVIGRDFDPAWHESIGHDRADGRREGEITTELRRGYRIGQRLLRPAMVKVAQA
jgi:molecular chaperone GrpE